MSKESDVLHVKTILRWTISPQSEERSETVGATRQPGVDGISAEFTAQCRWLS